MIYLDNAASTQIDEEVLELMNKISKDCYANPSSLHRLGQRANAILENAREEIASILSCKVNEVIFTGSASEANSMVMQYPHRAIAYSAIEHSSVNEMPGRIVEVDETGMLKLDSIPKDVDLLSVIHVNNEIGTIQDIDKIRELYENLLHIDGSQSIPYVRLPKGYDTMTLSPQKFYGPKGVGILVAKERAKLKKLILGPHRERNRRGGTENIALIAGAALALAKSVKDIYVKDRIEELKKYFENCLKNQFNVKINGSNRAAHISNVSFLNQKADKVLFNLDKRGVFASSGSACSSGSLEPSHVLKAMQQEPDNSIRFSFSKYTTKEDLDYVLKVLKDILC